MASLNNEKIPPFDLGHNPTKDTVDEGVKGRIADDVVGNVDEK